MRQGQVEVFYKINNEWISYGLYLMCPDKCRRIVELQNDIKIIDFYNNIYQWNTMTPQLRGVIVNS